MLRPCELVDGDGTRGIPETDGGGVGDAAFCAGACCGAACCRGCCCGCCCCTGACCGAASCSGAGAAVHVPEPDMPGRCVVPGFCPAPRLDAAGCDPLSSWPSGSSTDWRGVKTEADDAAARPLTAPGRTVGSSN